MKIRKSLGFSSIAILVVVSGAIALVSAEREAQGADTGIPEPVSITFTVLYPLSAEVFAALQLPPPISEGPGQGIEGCGSWEATGAIDDHGTMASEELHNCGPCNANNGGVVKETQTFNSETNDSFVIDSKLLLGTGNLGAGPCTFKGGTGDYANLQGGHCLITELFFFIGPGDPAPGEDPDPNCFAGTGCPLDAAFGCLAVQSEIEAEVSVD
jgi:hypothetical protein